VTKALDENDKLKAGALPADPTADARPLRIAKPGAKATTTEPADLAAEDALLGSLLWCGANAPETLRVRAITDLLASGEPFYMRKNGDVYDAIVAVAEAGAEHDPVAVNAQLLKLQRSIGLDALRALVSEASTISERQARVYAESIRDAWARRRVIQQCRALMEDARGTKVLTEQLIVTAQTLAAEAADRSVPRAGYVWASQSAESLFVKLQTGKNTAIATGLRDVDFNLNGGLRPKETSLVAARTNVGKSLLATQIAEYMVTNDDTIGVLYVIMEMQNESLTARMLSARGGIPLSNIRRFVLNPNQWSSLAKAVGDFATKRIAFADSRSQTMAGVYALGRQVSAALNREGRRLAMIVVDHVGLIKPSAELLKKANREQQVAETSRAMGLIATELNTHVMGLVQIQREAEKQADSKIPKLHHLRESGALENDADTVMILHRKRNANSGKFEEDVPAALVIAKGRMDETSAMLLDFQRESARFADYNGIQSFKEVHG
jgi:replicative DNA helicase